MPRSSPTPIAHDIADARLPASLLFRRRAARRYRIATAQHAELRARRLDYVGRKSFFDRPRAANGEFLYRPGMPADYRCKRHAARSTMIIATPDVGFSHIFFDYTQDSSGDGYATPFYDDVFTRTAA